MCSVNDFEMDEDSNQEMKKSNCKVLTERYGNCYIVYCLPCNKVY